MAPRVLLLHGIWMRGFSMSLLAHRLRKSGFDPHIIDYASIFGGYPSAHHQLQRALESSKTPTHIVGHSLGGLMALASLNEQPKNPGGRIVCLGSPLAGSSAANSLNDLGAGWFLGKSGAILQNGVKHLPAQYAVGVIAGNVPRGVGRLFARFDQANDGTVGLSETRLPGVSEHVVVPVTHTGLIFSGLVATLTSNFLHSGHFRP